MVSMRGRRTVAALPEPQFSNVWVVFTACLLFSQALWAAHGIVHTLDGKNFEGEFALENGAITVTATNGTVERIALATLALLKVQPPAASVPAVAKGNGNGLLGMYYNSTELAGRVIARLDETVDFSWGLEAPMAGINRDYFSVRWTGEVEAPVTGEYRFFIQTDDGGRLWVDKKLLIDQWHIREQAEGAGRIQLEGGKKYEVRMEYFDNIGNAMARLLWSGPGIDKTVIPKSQLYARSAVIANVPPEKGLLGIYFNNADFTGRYIARLDSMINFDWSDGRPIQGIAEGAFSVRWLGQVQPRVDEHYTFHTETDGGVRLWIDNRLVIDQSKDEPATLASVPAQLRAGAKYDVRMEIVKTVGSAKARLFWSSPSTPLVIVPQEALFPADPAHTVRADEYGAKSNRALDKGHPVDQRFAHCSAHRIR